MNIKGSPDPSGCYLYLAFFMRSTAILLLTVLLRTATAQQNDIGAGLAFSRSMNPPVNALQLFDQVMEAWTWTFGKEPGAKILHSDRDQGTLEGQARLNFRSKGLTGREETMGTVSYLVHVQVRAGECRVTINGITHTGNRNTPRGGIHLGPIMRSDHDVRRTAGLGRGNVEQVHADIREVTTGRVTALLQAFEARIRSQNAP